MKSPVHSPHRKTSNPNLIRRLAVLAAVAGAIHLTPSALASLDEKARSAATERRIEPAKQDAQAAAAKATPTKSAKVRPKRAKDTDRVEITGSRIKQKIHRSGRVVDTAWPVVIIDNQEMHRRGATTVAEVLRAQPFFR